MVPACVPAGERVEGMINVKWVFLTPTREAHQEIATLKANRRERKEERRCL